MGAWIQLTVLLTLLTASSALLSETCPAKTNFLEVEPDADVKIGVLLNVHSRGEGLHGCGEATTEGVQIFEALRLAVSFVNHQTDVVNGQSVTNSLIPGIKIGLKVYDSCQRQMAAADHLIELFPVLKSGPEHCDSENSTLLLGAIDMTGISSNPEIAEVSRDLYIPVLPVTADSSAPPEQVAKVLAEVAHDMEWQRVAVIHADDEHSIHVTKLLSQVATTGRICITSVHSIPNVDSRGRIYNQPEFRVYKKVLSSVASRLQDNTGVLVIANGQPLHRLLKVMSESPDVVVRLQWLFSNVPETESLADLGNLLNTKRIYSISPFPGKIQSLEDHWSSRGVLESVTPEDRWFLELVMAVKQCRVEGSFPLSQLPVCSNFIIPESPVDSLKRTSRSAPAMLAVYSFVSALEKAWKIKCNGQRGICQELRSMSRMEFGSQFLDPHEVVGQGEDFRGPPELTGHKEKSGRSGDVDGSRLALSRYSFTFDKQVDYQQVIAYDSRTAEVQDSTFTYLPSKCSKEGCNDCVKLREPRLNTKKGSYPGGLIIGHADDVVLPVLLPIHKSGLNPLECSSIVNQDAIQDLEAALWAIDHVNADPGFLGGVKLSALVVDTCSSSLKVSQKLSDFLSTAAVTTGVPDITSFLTAIASGSADQVATAMSMLSAVNITTLSAIDVTPKSLKIGPESYSFQVAIQPEMQAQAIIDVFKQLDWDYISVIYGRDRTSQKTFEAFKTAAKAAGICMALEQAFDSSDIDESNRVVARLHKAQQKGASAVVLMTEAVAVRAIMTSAQRAIEADVLRPGDLLWFGSGEWSHNLGVIQGLESVARGALLFSPHQADISEFVTHFRKLKPETNKRNPYFTEFWQQNSKCKGSKCAGDGQVLLSYRPSSAAANMIQSVLVAATGLSVLRRSLCHDEEGICSRMMREPTIRQMYNRHLQFTASVRPDGKGNMFAFTQSGSGNTPVDIFNFKKVAGNSYVYQKIGSYQNGLSNMLSAVTYSGNGDEIELSSFKSQCHMDCGRCNRKTTDFLVLESPDNLYLAATFGLHKPTTNPLVCDQEISEGDLQALEAFLWSLDQINSDSKILPRIKLGGIVFDSCSSREKALRDVSNFLSSTLSSSVGEIRLPSVNGLVGFIPSDNLDSVVRLLVEVVSPLNITTVSPTASSKCYNDVIRFPKMLRLSLPNDVIALSFEAILKYFQWDYFSVVYSPDDDNKNEVFKTLKAEYEKSGIRPSIVETMPSQSDSWQKITDAIISNLAVKQREGARAVLLLLNLDQTTQILKAAERLKNNGNLKIGDFVWLALDNIEAFHAFPELSLGALSIRSIAPTVSSFKQYFERLTLRNNTRNPWFRKYWEQVFYCQGSSCSSGTETDLRQTSFKQDSRVPKIIESVFALAHGLDEVRRQICGDNVATVCLEMMDNPDFREMLFNFTKRTSFVRTDGSALVFNEENYAKGALEVFNFRQVGNNAHAFVEAGRYNDDKSLYLNTSLVRGYDARSREIQLYDIKSHCHNSNDCPEQQTTRHQQSTMEIPGGSKFSIGALIPLHQQGADLFTCGALDDKRMFQNLLGVMYAVDRINSNTTLLPSIQLSALIFDYCDQKQRAEEKLYSYFSDDDSTTNRPKVTPKSVMAMLTFDDDLSPGVTSILEAKDIPQINNPAALRMKRSLPKHPSMTFRTVPNTMGQVHTILSVLEHFNWKYVYVIHPENDFGKSAHWEFVQGARKRRICIAGAIEIPDKTSSSKMPAILQQTLTDSKAKVVVFLTDDTYLTRQVLQTAKETSLLPRFVWIGTEGWGQSSLAAEVFEGSGSDVTAITLKLESYDLPDFKTFFAALTPSRHDPIPDAWFEEFWQHHFRCHLQNSVVPQKQYLEICNGQEHLRPEDIVQDKYVYHTVAAIHSVAGALHEFLRTSCLSGEGALGIDDCGKNARTKLNGVIRKVLMGHEVACSTCGSDESAFGYQIYQLRNGTQGKHIYSKIGFWKDGVVTIEKDAFIGDISSSKCQGDCVQCSEQFENAELVHVTSQDPIHTNFKTVWGIIVTALSVLGIVLVIICTMYFLMAFPISIGTTVLGYMILFGLLILYSVNFAFIVSPTEGTCGIRRFVMGFAYSIIFSGMLVKVLNTWRLMGYNGNRMMTDGTRMSSPAGLLVVAVGLVIIQVVLTVAWLVLMPPKIGIYGDTWRCAPPNSFEDELIISLVYVMLLLVVTILFSILTWKCQDNNRESRWILACCLFVGLIWLAWTVLSTQLPLHLRDTTIVIANLLCATLVMLCLYLRKVYLYSKLTRQIKDRELKDHLKSTHYQHSMYGTLTKSIPGVAPVLYGSQASLTGKTFYGGSPFAHTTLDETPSETGGSTSSGSVQVQGTDLYPLEMYDAGSQRSLYGNKNMLVLDDTVIYSR